MAKIAEVIGRLEQAAKGGIEDRARRVMSTVLDDAEDRARANIRTRFRSGTGNLGRSVRSSVFSEGSSIKGSLKAGTDGTGRVPYGAIQEFGGTIRPRRRKWLAIPIHPSVGRSSPSQLNLPNTFVLEVRGNPFIVQKQEDGSLQFLWVLKKSVTLRGRSYLRDAFFEAVDVARKTLPRELASEVLGVESAGVISRG